MKIAIFTDTYKPLVNGVTYSIDMYAHQLMKHGAEVTIYSPSYNGQSVESDFPVKTFYSIGIPNYKEMRVVFPNIISIIKSIQEDDPDLIHIHSPGSLGLAGILVSKLFKKPLVCTFHNHPGAFTHYLPFSKVTNRNGEPLSEEAVWKIFLTIFKSSNLIICPTQLVKNEIQKRLKDKSIQLEVLSNGIDTEMFSPAKTLEPSNNALFVGRIALEKNIGLLISAFEHVVKKLPDAKLSIVGGGPVLDDLKTQAKNLGLDKSIKFYGETARGDLPNIYRQHNLFILPSISEVQPLVIMEAFATGIPVIGMKDSSLSEIVEENKNSLLVENNADSLSAGILDLFTNREKLETFSKNAYNIAKKYDINSMGKNLLDLYNSLLK